MKIYISASWRQRELVRMLADSIRNRGHAVYDFTDPACRGTEEIPPENFPEPFDPEKVSYGQYLSRVEWMKAVLGNKRALDSCDLVILLLPCGSDATADWAYAVGKGKRTVIVGHPGKGERSPVHLWADLLFNTVAELLNWLDTLHDDFIHF